MRRVACVLRNDCARNDEQQVVESRGGALAYGWVSSPPLVKPNARISRIRLSHWVSCRRPRKALSQWRQAFQTVGIPQLVIREAHIFPLLHLTLLTEPLSQPFRRVSINRTIGGTDLPKTIVVGPVDNHTVEPSNHLLRVHPAILCGRLLTNVTAKALNPRLAWSGGDIRPRAWFAIIAPKTIPEKFKWFLRTSQASSLAVIDRQV